MWQREALLGAYFRSSFVRGWTRTLKQSSSYRSTGRKTLVEITLDRLCSYKDTKRRRRKTQTGTKFRKTLDRV